MGFQTVDELYIYEIGVQSNLALQAWEAALGGLQRRETKAFWLAMQGILISTGNISKILWPPNKKFADRGKRLRTLLHVAEDSLLQDRTFRNHFEHFDERLQIWFDSPRPAGFGDQNIGPISSFGGGVNKPHWLRNYDPVRSELYFAGETLNLCSLISDVQALCKDTVGK